MREKRIFRGESFLWGIFVYVSYAYNILLQHIKINIYLLYRNIVSWYQYYQLNNALQGGCTGGRYGAEERQTTGWLGTCRNTFPCQTTNIMEGEPLGGRWWVLRIEKGGGKAGQIPRLCVQVKVLFTSPSPSLLSINSCIIIIMGGCGWGSPPCGGDGGGWSGGCREPTNFAFDNSAYR